MNPATINTGCKLNCCIGFSRHAKPSRQQITQNRVNAVAPINNTDAMITVKIYSHQDAHPHVFSRSSSYLLLTHQFEERKEIKQKCQTNVRFKVAENNVLFLFKYIFSNVILQTFGSVLKTHIADRLVDLLSFLPSFTN